MRSFSVIDKPEDLEQMLRAFMKVGGVPYTPIKFLGGHVWCRTSSWDGFFSSWSKTSDVSAWPVWGPKPVCEDANLLNWKIEMGMLDKETLEELT